LYVSDKDASHK